MSNKPIKFIRSTDKMVLWENYFPDKYKYVVNDAYLDAKEKWTIKPNNHVENYEEKKEEKKSEDKKLEEKKKEEEKIKSFYWNDTNIKEKDWKQIIELSDDWFWIPWVNMEKDKEYEFYNKEERKKEEEKKLLESLNKNKSVSNNRVISRRNINNNWNIITNKWANNIDTNIDTNNNTWKEFLSEKDIEIIKNKARDKNNKEKNKTYNISNNIYKDIRTKMVDFMDWPNQIRWYRNWVGFDWNADLKLYIEKKYWNIVSDDFINQIYDNVVKEFNWEWKIEKDHYRKKADDLFNKVKVSDDKFNITDKQNKQISLLKATVWMRDPISYLKDKWINIDKSKYNILINSIKSWDNVKIKNNLDYYLK